MANTVMDRLTSLETENIQLKAKVAHLQKIVDSYTLDQSDYMCVRCGYMYDSESSPSGDCPNCGCTDEDARKILK